MTHKEDSWFRLLEENGEFTVKSCYRDLQGDRSDGGARFWNKLWSLQVPRKVTMFLWRVCTGCLPTNQVLTTRRVEVSNQCPWCHSAIETDKHVLFECDFARTTWIGTGLEHMLQMAVSVTAGEVLRNAFAVATRDQCVQIGMYCWSLWNRRNKWVWDKANGSVFGVKAAANNLLFDWREARKGDTRRQQLGEGRKKWSKPPVGWFKMNVDAAVNQDGRTGVGTILRDEQGRFIRAKCNRIAGTWTPREAEAIGLKEALTWIKTAGLCNCVVETDSKILATACKGTKGGAYFNTIVADCVFLLKHLENVLVEFVFRYANNVADVLAKAALSESGLGEWNVTPPDFLLHVLDSDLN